MAIGAYPSALHVRWSPPPGLGKPVAALPVDNEPTPFWNGSRDEVNDLVEDWRAEFFNPQWGQVTPAVLNGQLRAQPREEMADAARLPTLRRLHHRLPDHVRASNVSGDASQTPTSASSRSWAHRPRLSVRIIALVHGVRPGCRLPHCNFADSWHRGVDQRRRSSGLAPRAPHALPSINHWWTHRSGCV
jgi:hypothetical protein